MYGISKMASVHPEREDDHNFTLADDRFLTPRSEVRRLSAASVITMGETNSSRSSNPFYSVSGGSFGSARSRDSEGDLNGSFGKSTNSDIGSSRTSSFRSISENSSQDYASASSRRSSYNSVDDRSNRSYVRNRLGHRQSVSSLSQHSVQQYNGYNQYQEPRSYAEQQQSERREGNNEEFRKRGSNLRPPVEVETPTFNQTAVEDIFSYARHNRVDDIERMLDSGVPVDIRDQYGNTILLIACQNGLKRVAKAALRRGADINCNNMQGNTPLHFCYAYGYGETLGQYMISKGANTQRRNSMGLVCFDGITG